MKKRAVIATLQDAQTRLKAAMQILRVLYQKINDEKRTDEARAVREAVSCTLDAETDVWQLLEEIQQQ